MSVAAPLMSVAVSVMSVASPLMSVAAPLMSVAASLMSVAASRLSVAAPPLSVAAYFHPSFRADPRNMRVQGCGDEFLDSLAFAVGLRLTRAHTPVQSYLSTPLRFG